MNRILSALVVSLSLAGTAAAAYPIIGTFGAPRTASASLVNGSLTTQARASLFAHYPSTALVDTPTLTSAFLSGINTLIIDSNVSDTQSITPLSAAEQSALYNYVYNGGTALLVIDGYYDYSGAAQSMVAPFGMTIVDDGLSGYLTGVPTNPIHPIFSGPFGTTSSLSLYGSGLFSNLGPYAHGVANMTATNMPVMAVIEAGAIGPHSGRVILTSDTTFWLDNWAGGDFSHTEPLWLNSINYLLAPVPESASWVTGSLGLAGLGLTVWRRRQTGRRVQIAAH